MTITHRFTGKGLFYIAGFICIISFVLAPVGILFIWMARRAKVEFTDSAFVYRMLTTKTIPYAEVKSITQARPKTAYAHMDAANTTKAVVTVIPLIIEYTKNGSTKKTKLSLNFFERAHDILNELEARTGRRIIVEQ